MQPRTQKLVASVLLLGALASQPSVRAASSRLELRGTSEYLPPAASPEREALSVEELRASTRSDGGRYVDLGSFPALRGRALRASG